MLLPLVFLCGGELLAAKDKFIYPPQKLSLKDIRDIKVVGVKGNLQLIGHKNSRHLVLKVQHSKGRRSEDWHLSVERRGRTLFLEVFNVAYGKQWRNLVREDQWPEFDIEITAPRLPIDVAWREGRVDIVHWNGDLDLSLLKGQISARAGSGKLNLQPVAADVAVSDHRGPVSIRGESGGLVLARIMGPVNVNWLSGQVELKDCQGNTQIETRSGRVAVRGLKGTLHAKGESTQWDLSGSSPADLNVISTSGSVHLAWTGGSRVFLSSKRGKIAYPSHSFLKSSARDGLQVVEGVKPAKSMGQVFVRSESGAITWR